MKFEVELVQERTFFDHAMVIVEAENQDDAETEAIEMAKAFKVTWAEGDEEHTSVDAVDSVEIQA